MTDIERLLTRWQTAGVLDAPAAQRIRAWELQQQKPAGLRWEVIVALIVGAILLACGVALFVSAHWDDIGPGSRFALVMAMVAVFHIGGALASQKFRPLSMSLHAVGTLATGAAIALVGQIFNIAEHWPAAVLMWAVAALAGWLLLQDEPQQLLTVLLFPAWMLSELTYYTERHIGQDPYIGRFLFVWGILFVTVFLGSNRHFVRWIAFAAGAIASLVGVIFMLSGWESYGGEFGFLGLGIRIWAWIAIAAVPLLIAVFKGWRGLVPPAAAVVAAIALPWCQHVTVQYYTVYNGARQAYTSSQPNLAAHALVAAFAVSLTWWGVHVASRALVNLGVVAFAITVGWFYFSNLFDKFGRSLGLIGLGILFLLGGWLLERTRRRLILGMGAAKPLEAL